MTPLPLTFDQEPDHWFWLITCILYFKYFFYYCDYQNISDETNTCAEQFLQNKQLYEKPWFKRWKDTTALEMKRFFAVVTLFARSLHFWIFLDRKSSDISPVFPSVMSRDRCPGIEAYFILQVFIWTTIRNISNVELKVMTLYLNLGRCTITSLQSFML